jgi:hypothetical protein
MLSVAISSLLALTNVAPVTKKSSYEFFPPRNEEEAILLLEKVRDILVAGIHSLKCNSKA